MAKKMPNGKKFLPGNVANPHGRSGKNPEVTIVRRLTALELAEIGSDLLNENVEGLKEVVRKGEEPNSNISALKYILARALVKATGKDDLEIVERILNRVVGPIKISEPPPSTRPPGPDLNDDELKAKIQENLLAIKDL